MLEIFLSYGHLAGSKWSFSSFLLQPADILRKSVQVPGLISPLLITAEFSIS